MFLQSNNFYSVQSRKCYCVRR